MSLFVRYCVSASDKVWLPASSEYAKVVCAEYMPYQPLPGLPDTDKNSQCPVCKNGGLNTTLLHLACFSHVTGAVDMLHTMIKSLKSHDSIPGALLVHGMIDDLGFDPVQICLIRNNPKQLRVILEQYVRSHSKYDNQDRSGYLYHRKPPLRFSEHHPHRCYMGNSFHPLVIALQSHRMECLKVLLKVLNPDDLERVYEIRPVEQSYVLQSVTPLQFLLARSGHWAWMEGE